MLLEYFRASCVLLTSSFSSIKGDVVIEREAGIKGAADLRGAREGLKESLMFHRTFGAAL